ncbi:DUF2891 domain-containing protein [Niabella ginsengisoli]|uniref:DUF2891 domain-containing protein n=1 Tax=Niabella ginsengisoli TaxID=522298 RepID=A0ABS9SNU3_9BACT|nr:DUF2891 domain-containing protein [Niabella ginsengisoli]MCH5600058.1 DUF2891 domain-containing protein [Niabella ginsengisoli]
MKKLTLPLLMFLCAQSIAQTKLTLDVAQSLSQLPLHCINTEFPNKTSHLSDGPEDARLLPHQLHPVFYGCLDWHSSVHGHWMLIKLLKQFPDLPKRDSIVAVLDNSFQLDKMRKEAEYFGKYTASQNYERTYGWAWLLKLDEELLSWNDSLGHKWHQAMQPLTQKIETLWKAFLPKQTYPNRSGVHGNTAFGLCFALDWARAKKDVEFEKLIIKRAKDFYLNNKNIPAHLEPDGADFFSPSLMAADLMTRILPQADFVKWLNAYYTEAGVKRIGELPVVSDRNDYHIVHLDGLSFSRAWCMRNISDKLPSSHKYKTLFNKNADKFLNESLPKIFNGGYGGEHWLASFAVYALLR